MNTRVYDKKIDINNQKTKIFWEDRANSNNITMATVLLGDDKTGKAQEDRNKKEASLLLSLLDNRNFKILDIGCGNGRWANNLYNKIDKYLGVDYTKSLINYASSKFLDSNHITFLHSSVLDLNVEEIGTDYDLIICTGVLMYINDLDLKKVFELIHKISPKYFYLQESISLINSRLTLNNIESASLNANYSAIYRTPEEYEKYFTDFNVIKSDLLLDDKIGGRSETNAKYWFLMRK